MFNKISNDWNQWIKTLEAARTLKKWQIDYPELNNWTIENIGKPAFGAQRIDAMQSCLIKLAQSGSGPAALALANQLMPALKSLSRTYSGVPEQEILSYFYETLLGRNLIQRPNKVSANLVLDTKQKLYSSSAKVTRIRDAVKSAAQHNTDSNWISESEDVLATKSIIDQAIKISVKQTAQQQLQKIAYQHWMIGDPIQEIAADFGLSQTAVTTKLWRLRKNIKELYTKAEIEHLAA